MRTHEIWIEENLPKGVGFFSVSEAAQASGYSVSFFRKALRRGDLKALQRRAASGSVIRIPRTELVHFLAEMAK